MKMMSKAIAAVLIAAASTGGAMAAGQSPAYVGVDVGAYLGSGDSSIGRAFAGYTLGSTQGFGLEQVHAVELMVFTSRFDTRKYALYGMALGGDRVTATGLGINWATSTRLNDQWSLNSRLGANYAWATTRFSNPDASYTYDRPGVTVGIGAAYKLSPNVSMTLDLSYMPIRINRYDKKTAPTLGTGLRYDF